MSRSHRSMPVVSSAQRAKGGKRDDLGGRYFRSTMEANVARWLEWRRARGDIQAWDYEPKGVEFWFPVKRGNRSYKPDFVVTETDGSTTYIEVKGWMRDGDRIKLDRMARHFPEIKVWLIDTRAYRDLATLLSRAIPGWEGG